MKLKLGSMMICLLIISSTVTAQVHPMHKDNKQSVWHKFKNSDRALSLQKINNEEKLGELNIDFWDGENWEDSERIRNQFTNGKITESLTEVWEGNGWSTTAKITFSYSGELLVSEQYEELDEFSKNLVPAEKYIYNYTGEGEFIRLWEIIYQEWVANGAAGSWVNSEKDAFTYAGGPISSGVFSEWTGEDWEAVEQFTAEDTDSGAVLTYSENLLDEWVPTYREIYPNFSLNEIYNFYLDLTYGSGTEFFYLHSTYFPDYIFQESVDDEWENAYSQFTNKYYDLWDGSITKIDVTSRYWEGEWIPEFFNELWLYGKANADSANFIVVDEGVNVRISQEKYSYDESDRIIEAVTMYEMEEGLENSTRLSFTWSEVTTGVENPEKPFNFSLNPAYPNPFNPTTNITYSMERAGDIKINVYDVLGRFVATLVNGSKSAGEHHVQFDAGNLSSGLYIVRMEAAGYLKTQMVTLLK
ncbi:MAG: T9SS type A sorting domain-containing protein [Balneolaceae bacterium]